MIYPPFNLCFYLAALKRITLVQREDRILVLGGQPVLIHQIMNSFAIKGFVNVNHLKIVSGEDQISHANSISIEDQSALENTLLDVDYVIYLHALVQYDSKSKKALFKQNVIYLRDLLNSCLQQNIKGFIYCSTTEALDRPLHHQPIKEEDTWQKNKGRSEYSKSRFLGELEVWRAMAEGLKVMVIAPTNIIANNTNNNIVNYLLKLTENNSKSCPNGSGGFIDIRDVAQFMTEAAEIEACWNEKYIINAQNMSNVEFMSLLNPSHKNYKHQPNNMISRWIAFSRHLLKSSSPYPASALADVLHQTTSFDATKALRTGIFDPIPIAESVRFWYKIE